MSPRAKPPYSDRACFPRVSGDEPLELFLDDDGEAFSPRERG